MARTIGQLWNALERYAQQKAKRSLALRDGASEDAIVAAEQKMNLTLPRDFRASLLVHEGQHAGDDVFPWMPGCAPLAGLDAMVDRWAEEQDLVEHGVPEPYDARIMNVLYHPKRVPIAGTPSWDGDNTYLDLFPARRGKAGQLLTFTSECDMEILADSFRAALEAFVAALESGAWIYDPQDEVVRPKRPSGDPGHPAEDFAAWVRRRKK